MQPTHVAKPELIRADVIHNCSVTLAGMNIALRAGRTVDVELLSGSPVPRIGDYLIEGDGFTYVLPKDVFEQRYMSLALASWPALTYMGEGHHDMGVASGAGTSRGNLIHVYRDAKNGALYYRTPMEFAERMKRK
ncbi:hypothetical protein [Massilia sp. TSP1-1-2]|uniref:hypothetical protein n=1 Tax=Massilia sp. TSP1-1-2 TaxID=2804649 RepID=UPI003CF4925E